MFTALFYKTVNEIKWQYRIYNLISFEEIFTAPFYLDAEDFSNYFYSNFDMIFNVILYVDVLMACCCCIFYHLHMTQLYNNAGYVFKY